MHDLRQEVCLKRGTPLQAEKLHPPQYGKLSDSRAGTDCPDTWDQSGQSYGFFNLHGVKGSGTAPLYRKRKIRRSRADADGFSSRRHCDDTHPMCEWQTITLKLDTTLQDIIPEDSISRGRKGYSTRRMDLFSWRESTNLMIFNGRSSGEILRATRKNMNIRSGDATRKRESNGGAIWYGLATCLL